MLLEETSEVELPSFDRDSELLENEPAFDDESLIELSEESLRDAPESDAELDERESPDTADSAG